MHCVPIHICLLNRQREYTAISTRSAAVEMEDVEAPIKGNWDTFWDGKSVLYLVWSGDDMGIHICQNYEWIYYMEL